MKVLNTHFTTLEWIDQTTANLQAKIKQVARQQEIQEDRMLSQQRR